MDLKKEIEKLKSDIDLLLPESLFDDLKKGFSLTVDGVVGVTLKAAREMVQGYKPAKSQIGALFDTGWDTAIDAVVKAIDSLTESLK